MDQRIKEYCDYVATNLDTIFSFDDWHEQTHGKPLTKEEKNQIFEDDANAEPVANLMKSILNKIG